MGVLKLYTVLLGIWVEQTESSSFQEGGKTTEIDAVLENARLMVDEVEATGLLLLCSHMAAVRR